MAQGRNPAAPVARIALKRRRATTASERDRRRAPRVRVEAPILAARPGHSGSLLFCAEATDLSEKGLLLLTPWSLPVQSKIELTLLVPCRDGTREECVLPAEVVRCDREQLAVAFPQLRPRQLLRLRDYVWRARRSSGSPSPSQADYGAIAV